MTNPLPPRVELLPCPFCLGKADVYFKTYGSLGKRYNVFCNDCGNVNFDCRKKTEVETIALWNTRATTNTGGDGEVKAIASLLHYPECWDTAAYPTLLDAVAEIHEGCSTCISTPQKLS